MENSMVRQRYARRPTAARRRRRVPRSGHKNLRQVIARQLIICIILLIMIGIVKSINISATNFVTDQVKYILSHNIELKNILSYVDKLAADIRSSVTPVTADKLAAQPADKPVTQADDMTAAKAVAEKGTGEADAGLKIDTVEAHSSIENEIYEENSNAEEAATVLKTAVLSASSEDAPFDMYNMLIPVDGTLSSLYGEITDTITGNVKTHNGIDINVIKGSSVKAALDGEVAATGSSPAYGVYIKIKHSDSLQTVYANCYSLIAEKGENVKRGDIIASIDAADMSVGAHLHFEVWKDGTAVDPLDYIDVPAR